MSVTANARNPRLKVERAAGLPVVFFSLLIWIICNYSLYERVYT